MSKKIESFYTSLKHWGDVYDKTARQMPASTESKDVFLAWQERGREKLKSLLKLDEFEICDLSNYVVGSINYNKYKIDKMILETEPDVFMTFYVVVHSDIIKHKTFSSIILLPDNTCEKDSKNIKLEEFKSIEASKSFYLSTRTYSFAEELARKGYMVFVPDIRSEDRQLDNSWSDTNQTFKRTCSHRSINNIAIALGYSALGMLVWDYMRLADYIISRPDSNGKFACVSLADNDRRSLYLAAVDERIQSVVTSGWNYGIKHSLLMNPYECACNYVHNLWLYFDFCDIASLIAPRPLFSAYEEVELAVEMDQLGFTKKVYLLLGSPEKLFLSHYTKVKKNNDEERIEFITNFLAQE